MSIVLISFDGVKDTEFEHMAADASKYPHIARFMEEAAYKGDVFSMFVSNTYPVHTSVSTGLHPRDHGIISNYVDPRWRIWAQRASLIKAKTMFDACAEKGLTAGAIAWPVTGGANIKWNLPEIHVHTGQNRLWQHMRWGSILFQLGVLARHGPNYGRLAMREGKLGKMQTPLLDGLLADAAADLLRKKQPDLVAVHLVSYDMIAHAVGLDDPALDLARASLDACLGRILAAAPKDAAVIVFSDHGHLNVHTTVNLREIYSDALYEQCGGCAFFNGSTSDIKSQPWFERFLTDHEMDVSGYKPHAAWGIAAKRGYCFAKHTYKSNHGYPTDYDEFRVFYAMKNGKHGLADLPFDDLRNVTAIVTRELGL